MLCLMPSILLNMQFIALLQHESACIRKRMQVAMLAWQVGSSFVAISYSASLVSR